MLLFGRKITAHEACERNLVAKVLPSATFEHEAWTMVEAYSKLPPQVRVCMCNIFTHLQSLMLGKQLVRDTFRTLLHNANENELTVLEERMLSDECATAAVAFFQLQQTKKAKL
jgi:peroxisomal 3,2-trans-enoyl-CoA isomerase